MGKASYAETEDLPTAEYGDTYTGVSLTLTVNGAAKNLTGATIVLTLDKGYGTLTTVGSGGLTITDAAAGVFTIDEQVITFAPGNHHYEIKFTFSDGKIKTYREGQWEITA